MEKPTANEVRSLLSYDAASGIFTWKVSPSNRVRVGGIAGAFNRHTGYTSISIRGKLHRAHRLAWLYETGEWPADQVDHINGDRSDNRIANLRVISASLNLQNQREARGNNKSSGLLGVSIGKNGRNWRTSIRTSLGKQQHIGYFDTKEAAHDAYVEAKRRLHSACTI